MSKKKFWDILDKSSIQLTTNEVGTTGAKAQKYSDGSYSMIIDVDNPKILADIAAYGNTYSNTVILHEFGHFMGDALGYNTEAGASAFALGLGSYANIHTWDRQTMQSQGWSVDPW